jgi:hypothetical protein
MKKAGVNSAFIGSIFIEYRISGRGDASCRNPNYQPSRLSGPGTGNRPVDTGEFSGM